MIFAAALTHDRRTGERLTMPFDSPRCRHCGRPCFPLTREPGELSVRIVMFAADRLCRYCSNAKEASLHRERWRAEGNEDEAV